MFLALNCLKRRPNRNDAKLPATSGCPLCHSEQDPRNARVVIDACKPFGRRTTFPLVVRASDDLEREVRAEFGKFSPTWAAATELLSGAGFGVTHTRCPLARERLGGAMLLDLLDRPVRCSGSWLHGFDGEVAGGADADSFFVLSSSGKRWSSGGQGDR